MAIRVYRWSNVPFVLSKAVKFGSGRRRDGEELKYGCKKIRPMPFFTPKIDIFKQTILNTAYIKTLEIFPSARESLSIPTSTSKSVRNQSCLQCS